MCNHMRYSITSCFYSEKEIEPPTKMDQYTAENISLYEKIFGKYYISPGGKGSAEKFVNLLDLQNGQKVLDVACGVGGPAFYMAR